jgi:PAS domain S-box-containing protein
MGRVTFGHLKGRGTRRKEAQLALRDSQLQLSSIIESAMDAIITVDSRQRILVFNHAAEQMFHCSAGEALGQPLDRFIPKPFRRAHKQHIKAFGKTGVSRRAMGGAVAVSGLRADGEEFPIEASISQIEVRGQRLFTVIMRDISERRNAEAALRESEERFRTMADAAPVMIWAADTTKLCNYFNQPWLHFVGRAIEDELGNGWADNVHPEDYDRCLKTYGSAFDARQPFTMEYRLRRRDNEYRWLLDVGVPRVAADGTFAGYIGSCVDITERKRSEESLAQAKGELQKINAALTAEIAERRAVENALRRSQSQLAGIIESAMDAIITVDSAERVVVFNRAAEQMFRCSALEAIGQRLERFIPEESRALHHEHVRKFGLTGVTTRVMAGARTVFGLRAEGEKFPVEASISQIQVGNQKLYTVILRDVTRRKRDEERLRQQAALLDEARDAILVRDLNDCIVYWNKGAEALFGWTAAEALGEKTSDLLFLRDVAQFDKAVEILARSGEWNGELILEGKKKDLITVNSRWSLVRDEDEKRVSVLMINTDISERKRVEQQFLRAQRMESIGTLAGGIAHDLNNVLSPIMMAVEVLRMKHVDEESQVWLRMLETSAGRGADMVKQILSFARGGGLSMCSFKPCIY